MDKPFLEECLAKGMSLDAIGELVGKHPSTVGYWPKKHGLEAVNADLHAHKGPLDKERLESSTNAGFSLAEIARRSGRSVSSVRYWMARYEIEPFCRRRERPSGNPKRAEMLCKQHGMAEFVLEGRGFYRCVQCRVESVARRRRIVKRRLG